MPFFRTITDLFYLIYFLNMHGVLAPREHRGCAQSELRSRGRGQRAEMNIYCAHYHVAGIVMCTSCVYHLLFITTPWWKHQTGSERWTNSPRLHSLVTTNIQTQVCITLKPIHTPRGYSLAQRIERFGSQVESDVSQIIPKELASTVYFSREFCSSQKFKHFWKNFPQPLFSTLVTNSLIPI